MVLVSVSVALSLVACVGPGSRPVPTPVDKSRIISESRTSVAAPEAFRLRPRLPSCGDVVLEQGQTPPQAPLDCLDSASTAGGAEFALARPTSEGAYIVTFYRAAPSIDGVEVFVDATRDQFGQQEWRQGTCPSVASISDPQTCNV